MSENQNPAPHTLDKAALLAKRQELVQLKHGLEMKFNNVVGQIELIDQILGGKFVPAEATEEKPT